MTNASNSDLPARREGPSLIQANETSPLLKPGHAHGTWRSALSSFLDDNTGLLLVAASQVFFSSMNMAVKLLNSLDEPVPTFELILVRMAITYAGSVAYMYWKKIPDPLLGPKGIRTLLVFRGFSGFFGLSGVYFSLQYLSLSDATVLTFMVPIFTGFSGAVFLKEPVSLRELLAGLCSFLGVILIARPQFLFGSPQAFLDPEVTPTQRMLSVIAALIGVAGATGAYTLIRAIGKRAHVLHSMMSFSSQCVLGSTLGMILFKVPIVVPTRPLWLVMLFLIGIFGFLAQTLLTMGLQRETVGRGSLAIYSSIVFATMFEFTVFHTTPSTLSIIGASMIVGSAIYTTLTKQMTATKPASGTISVGSAGGTSASDRDDDPEA
ncbi:integral membrane protein DUF6 [Lactarius akahatsu]|uniref:Integral membrane protein DUF6 n=1 Tax=Lactarius akahatsu TaxID=416441 RepID=A0AAD4LE51_9AGAM|nr:integral membrane protein DUF6 [Lactarius akahatsu]